MILRPRCYPAPALQRNPPTPTTASKKRARPLTNHRGGAALTLHQSLIIQVGVKSERKGYSFQPALLSPPQRASQSAFLLTSPHRDLASQSRSPPPHPPLLSTVPLSSLPAPVMSHAIWFSAASSRKRDLLSGGRRRGRAEEKRRAGRSSSSCEWKVGRNARGWGLNCVRQMRRARGAASAMCCTDTQTHVCTQLKQS